MFHTLSVLENNNYANNFKMMKFNGPWSLNRSYCLDPNMSLQPEMYVESAQISTESWFWWGKRVPVEGAPG